MALMQGLRNLFGKGSKPGDRKKAISLDLITADLDHIPEGALAALWELHDARMPHTPRMIRESRAVMNGTATKAPMAPEWDMQDRADYDAGGPEAQIRPRETALRLASKQARVKRPLSTLGPDEQRDSTRIEQWSNALLDKQFADYPTTEMLLNESQSLWICVPSPAHYQRLHTLYDEFEEEGPYATQDEVDALPAARRREYEVANPSEDEPRYKRMRKRYRVDKDGAEDDGSDGFAVDYKRAGRAFERDLQDAYAQNVPILLRGPISRLDFVPIDPRFSGTQTLVEGVIIRTLYRRSKLRRELRLGGYEELLEPAGLDGRDGDLYLYELWAYDDEGCPFVAYQVGSSATHFEDEPANSAVIKLGEAFPGLTELPISFEYGQHTADPDPDKRGLAFPYPYIRQWKRRDAILTALCISIEQSGYPMWVQEITSESIEAMQALGGDIALEFRAAPGVVHRVFGKVSQLESHGSNQDVKVVLEALQMLTDRDLPSKGAFGGEGPTSGLDRQVLGRDMEVSFGGVIEGYRRQKEAMGRFALMIGSALGRLCDRPVELYAIGTAPNPATGGTATTRTRLTLPPDLCKGNWDVVAQFETVPGERLAQSSLFLEALSQGAILLREWREWGVGDQNPEQFLWEKMLEDFYLKDPAGRLYIYRQMLETVADGKMKEVLELAHQGEMTDSLGGMATAAMGDLLGQAPAPDMLGTGLPANTGMRLGGVAQSQLAGANAGAIAASAASAGSPLDGAVMA